MGRKILLTFACCVTFAKALEETQKSRITSSIIDNISDESANLYHNVPFGMYASALPYEAFTANAPTIINAPKNVRVLPVNEQRLNVQNVNGFLKDSYGNTFLNSPQTIGFKANHPQQFVQLQELPAHLSQPLVSAPNSFHSKQATPHFFAPSQFKVSALQASSPAPFSRYAVSHPSLQNANVRNFANSPFPNNNLNLHRVVQQQPTSNKAIFINAHTHEQYNKLNNEPKFQLLQENLRENSKPHNLDEIKNYNQQPFHAEKDELQVAPAKDTTVTTFVNGKKSVVTLQTKPPLPLLDISLLEPLTFKNPLVPQVQHFLPRISEATYHKLPDYKVYINNKNKLESSPKNPKNYDEIYKGNPKNKSPKKKQKKPTHQDDIIKDSPNPTITVKGIPNVSPEYSYEINSPNYKETYKEQVVSYNKETQSEPVNYNYNNEQQSDPVHYSYKKETQSEPIYYTYEKQVQKKPVHYSYVHDSSEPQQEKQVIYENKGQGPKHLIYSFKTNDKFNNQNNEEHELPRTPSEEKHENVSQNEGSAQRSTENTDNVEHEQYADAPQTSHNLEPEHREENYQHRLPQEEQKSDDDFLKSFAHIINDQAKHFQPVTPEYNQDVNVLPTHKPVEHIRVDPNQHIQRPRSEQPQNTQYDLPNKHIYEKSKRIIVRDETPESIHSLNEKQMTQTVDQEENNEENFEKAYKNAAFGFPAYESNSEEIEKDIYNPETYGVNRDHSQFDIEHAPFQQYYAEGDKFPQYTHSKYKDTRDKTKEDYFLDYSVNKPESMIDRYKNKVEYYKMYKKQRPEKYFGFEQNGNKENKQKNSKYYSVPSYLFNYAPQQKSKQQLARFKTSPQYGYDYTNEGSRDNTAYGTQPHQRVKTKTLFVEPQFQYGFEPSSLPLLLDSELATMASNLNPENENPGTRKKIYKEKWYIKKTNTEEGTPTSR